MSQIISVYNSKLLSENLTPSFVTICQGNTLTFTEDIVVEQFPDRRTGGFRTIEMLVFMNQHNERVKLPLSKILKSRGTVGESLQKAIWNKDLKTGKDLIKILREKAIHVSNVGFDDKPMPNGEWNRRIVYTLHWVD